MKAGTASTPNMNCENTRGIKESKNPATVIEQKCNFPIEFISFAASGVFSFYATVCPIKVTIAAAIIASIVYLLKTR
ncbi:MAG: hypothetical protein ACJA13_003898 [Paraglaciecola sp.]|jgi:hypothetical protein